MSDKGFSKGIKEKERKKERKKNIDYIYMWNGDGVKKRDRPGQCQEYLLLHLPQHLDRQTETERVCMYV